MYYFISDVHLGFFEKDKNKKIENRLIELLDKISNDCQEIFFVGDIFDYWFDYNRVVPRDFYRILTKIEQLTSKGIKITYLMGNHDFGHYNFFQQDLGIKVIEEDIEREISNKKFFISHGDGKDKKDVGYLLLKKVLRNKFNRLLYKYIHPDLGIGIASGSSKKSRKYTSKKDYGEYDAQKEYALKKIVQGFDYVVMGHRHRVEKYYYKQGNAKGYYINLGDWIKKATFGRFDGEKFDLLYVKEYLKGEEKTVKENS